jgi:hypothetical protein
MILLREVEDVAAIRTATETAPCLRIRVDHKRRCLLAVERTARLVIVPGSFEWHVLLDEVDNIEAGFDFVSDGHASQPSLHYRWIIRMSDQTCNSHLNVC